MTNTTNNDKIAIVDIDIPATAEEISTHQELIRHLYYFSHEIRTNTFNGKWWNEDPQEVYRALLKQFMDFKQIVRDRRRREFIERGIAYGIPTELIMNDISSGRDEL